VVSASPRKQGLRLADADLQIAATALRHNLEVVTGNVRHFERIPNLQLNRILATR
jgi:predicted nucleic acid-binding protein